MISKNRILSIDFDRVIYRISPLRSLRRTSIDDTRKVGGHRRLGGAAVGGIVGSVVGNPGAGVAIGGGLGLGAGALIGDQLQSQEYRR